MTGFKWISLAAAVLSFPCAVPAAAKVDVVQTSSAALASGSTFAWAPLRAIQVGTPDPAVANDIAIDRLRIITEAALKAKGYRQIDDPQQADLFAAYTIVMQPELNGKLTSNGGGCGLPFCGGASDYNLDTSHYTQGTLVLDLIERDTGRLVWRATSKKRVTGKDVSDKKLTALLREMTKSLPGH